MQREELVRAELVPKLTLALSGYPNVVTVAQVRIDSGLKKDEVEDSLNLLA